MISPCEPLYSLLKFRVRHQICAAKSGAIMNLKNSGIVIPVVTYEYDVFPSVLMSFFSFSVSTH